VSQLAYIKPKNQNVKSFPNKHLKKNNKGQIADPSELITLDEFFWGLIMIGLLCLPYILV
jgi:hypothetical protein